MESGHERVKAGWAAQARRDRHDQHEVRRQARRRRDPLRRRPVIRAREHGSSGHQDGDPGHHHTERQRKPDHARLRATWIAGAYRRPDDERSDPEDVQRRAERTEAEGRSDVLTDEEILNAKVGEQTSLYATAG